MWFLAILNRPWFVDSLAKPLPSSSCDILSVFCVNPMSPTSYFFFFFWRRTLTSHTHHTQVWSHYNQLFIQWPYFQIWSNSECQYGQFRRILAQDFLKDTVPPSADYPSINIKNLKCLNVFFFLVTLSLFYKFLKQMLASEGILDSSLWSFFGYEQSPDWLLWRETVIMSTGLLKPLK